MSFNFRNIIIYRWFLLSKYIRTHLFSAPLFGTKNKTLLIVKLDSIGDFVIFRNFIEEIKNSDNYKEYKITLCGNLWWKDIAEKYDNTFVDEFIWLDYSKLKEQKYLFNICWKLYKKRFHTVIHPTYSRCVFGDDITLHCGAKIKIGQTGDDVNLGKHLKASNDKRYTTLINIDAPYIFEFYRYKLFFQKLLNKDIAIKKPILNQLSSITNTIILCPGAKHTIRQWSPENFSNLAQLLNESVFPNCQFIICGSAAETHLANGIMKHTSLNFIDTTGKINLLELINLMASAKLVVTNDSGPFHIAVALNKKTICISNGNHYGRFNPYPIETETESSTLYPNIVNELVKGNSGIVDFQLKGSFIDINLLTVDEVFSHIKSVVAANV